MAQPATAPIPPAPPRSVLDTRYAPSTGRTITVRAGGDLQGALVSSQPGDTITVEAGAVFRGNFTLPNKRGTGWIVIRSSAPDGTLPPPGTRVTPSVAASMPKVVSPNSISALQTAPGSHNYRVIGIELTVADNVKTNYAIVALGGEQSSAADTPHDLIVDRCYIHGHATLNAFRGVLLNSASSAVIDSHISDIHVSGFDSQAILGYNGPGPFKIVNNYLEGAGENIMFGGADPKIPNLVPSDIEIRNNHIFKPSSWRRGDPSFVGIQWTIKNLLELKNAQRVHVEGNLLENVWAQAQGGAAVVLTPRNQDGGARWSVVQDVLFRNNIVRNAAGAFGGQSTDDGHPSQQMRRIAMVNNLWLGIGRTFFTMSAGPVPVEDFVVDHNTAIPTGYFAFRVEGGAPPALVRFQLSNNVMGFGAYGISPDPKGDARFAQWMPGATISRNALVSLGDVGDGQGAVRNHPHYFDSAMYVSFASATAAGLNAEGILTSTSPLKGAGTHDSDIGVNFGELRRAMGAGFPPSLGQQAR
jgi:hypothetical protein